ncbi:MAG TPA: hypothetical protein VMP89_18720 [Solirubrobacteraceae bacterium]|nr:hypothetical protein [Solirubrobacteraceae bacterium]
MRGRQAAQLLTVSLAVALALPAAALAAGSNPLAPGLPQPGGSVPTTPTPPIINPTTTSSTSGGGLSSSSVLIIAIGAVVLIVGISMFIWRDARRRAPVRHAHATPESGRSGSKRPVKPRKLSPAERRRRKRGRAR